MIQKIFEKNFRVRVRVRVRVLSLSHKPINNKSTVATKNLYEKLQLTGVSELWGDAIRQNLSGKPVLETRPTIIKKFKLLAIYFLA